MEKSRLIFQPSSFSERVSPYAKHEQPRRRKTIASFFTTVASQTCNTITNIFGSHQANNDQALLTDLGVKKKKNKKSLGKEQAVVPIKCLVEYPIKTGQTMGSLPASKKSLGKEQAVVPIKCLVEDQIAVPVKCLSGYPPKTGHTAAHPRGTDTSLAGFFLNENAIPGTNLTFWDIAKYSTSDLFFSQHIDTIMPMLCPSSCPYPNSDAPLLSVHLLHLIQTDPLIASKYLHGAFAILHFLGFTFSYSGGIEVRETSFKARGAYMKQHQNQWQFYQLLRSLLACGFYHIAYNLRLTLMNKVEDYGLSKDTLTEIMFMENSQILPMLNCSDGTAYWEAHIKCERAFADGRAFDWTLPPKSWASYYRRESQKIDPCTVKFEENSPPLLERKETEGQWRWHLPHLQAWFNTNPNR